MRLPPAERLPLTYPHVLGFPLAARLMARRSFPLPLLGLVHTWIEIVQRRPLLPGDRPDLTVHAEELRAHRRGVEVVLVTEASLGGEVVWRDRSGYLARTRTGGTGGGAPGGGATAAAEGRNCPPWRSGSSPPASGAGTPPCRATGTRSTSIS